MPEPPLSGEQRHPYSHRPSRVERFSQAGGGSKASLPVVDWSAAHKTALHLRAGEPLDSPRTPLRDEASHKMTRQMRHVAVHPPSTTPLASLVLPAIF